MMTPRAQGTYETLPTERQPLLVRHDADAVERINTIDEKSNACASSAQAQETILEDAIDTLQLGFPIAVSYLSWVGVREKGGQICLGHKMPDVSAAIIVFL
jgi:hypothetical protein